MSSLDTLDFQPMLITDVFESMQSSKAWYDKVALAPGQPAHPFISRTKARNGVDTFCARQAKPPEAGNAITIGLDTQTIGYQPTSFYTSQNIQVLRHAQLDQSNALILATLIKQQMSKFSWGGNGATLGRLARTRIMVPVVSEPDGSRKVDWEGLARLGARMLSHVTSEAQKVKTAPRPDRELSTLTYRAMLITDVFDEYRQVPAWFNTNAVSEGDAQHPHVTNTAGRNSVAKLIATQSMAPVPGNAITIGIDTQVVAYQPVPFYGATKVYQLRSRRMTEASALVLVASIRRGISKFSWGYKASAARLKKTRIMVPVIASSDGSTAVDWDGMDNHGQALLAEAQARLTPLWGSL